MMSDNALPVTVDAPPSLNRPRAFETIVYGGLAIGVLDFLDATIFFGSRGISPVRIFQHVASGLLGRASFDGGYTTFALGLFLHFVVAFGIATVFYIASLKLPMLIRHPVLWGMIYGVVAHFVMQYVVVPLSFASQGRFSLPVFLNSVIGHALLVGLPVALVARWSARKRG
jgi:hypothetical protein